MYEDEIRIHVEPNYMAAESSAAAERYAFSYRITIENRSDYTLTLRKRHWEITDAHGSVENISGTGVIGEQPVLMPGESFEYQSGMQLTTPWGSMRGSYEFENDLGSRFTVDIPATDLKSDTVLQ